MLQFLFLVLFLWLCSSSCSVPCSVSCSCSCSLSCSPCVHCSTCSCSSCSFCSCFFLLLFLLLFKVIVARFGHDICHAPCHFLWKFTCKMPDAPDTTSIDRRTFTIIVRTPLAYSCCSGSYPSCSNVSFFLLLFFFKVVVDYCFYKGSAHDHRKGNAAHQRTRRGDGGRWASKMIESSGHDLTR